MEDEEPRAGHAASTAIPHPRTHDTAPRRRGGRRPTWQKPRPTWTDRRTS